MKTDVRLQSQVSNALLYFFRIMAFRDIADEMHVKRNGGYASKFRACVKDFSHSFSRLDLADKEDVFTAGIRRTLPCRNIFNAERKDNHSFLRIAGACFAALLHNGFQNAFLRVVAKDDKSRRATKRIAQKPARVKDVERRYAVCSDDAQDPRRYMMCRHAYKGHREGIGFHKDVDNIGFKFTDRPPYCPCGFYPKER